MTMTETTTQNFDSTMSEMVRWINDMLDQNWKDSKYTFEGAPVVRVQKGRVNAKLITVRDGGRGSESVYGFVEIATGKIMKAASWKAPEPAKHERGNLYNESSWKTAFTPYGVAYLR